ncbi:MAG: hypothetical protein JW727_02740 [Candidatus Aenigmarchaeota archaeon]|nr:hypothetical protein [Candidatus Aenigmarchaeota archaeon]
MPGYNLSEVLKTSGIQGVVESIYGTYYLKDVGVVRGDNSYFVFAKYSSSNLVDEVTREEFYFILETKFNCDSSYGVNFRGTYFINTHLPEQNVFTFSMANAFRISWRDKNLLNTLVSFDHCEEELKRLAFSIIDGRRGVNQETLELFARVPETFLGLNLAKLQQSLCRLVIGGKQKMFRRLSAIYCKEGGDLEMYFMPDASARLNKALLIWEFFGDFAKEITFHNDNYFDLGSHPKTTPGYFLLAKPKNCLLIVCSKSYPKQKLRSIAKMFLGCLI